MSCTGVPSGLTANVWAATVVVGVVDEDVAADDGCEMVVLAARVWVVLLVDVAASFLDLRPGVGDSSASSFELDVLASVDFASSFVDDVGEDLVPAGPASPLEARDVEADDVDAADAVDDFDSDDFDSEDFESADFESADEVLEEPD